MLRMLCHQHITPPYHHTQHTNTSPLKVDAVEMFDRAALRQCSNNEQMVSNVTDMVESDELAAALLVECRGRDEQALQVCCVMVGCGV